MANLQIVTTPTRDWLAERARTCSERMLVGSPYVNKAIIDLTDMVSKEVSRTLVTRTDLRDFAVGASSLDTLCTLVKDGVAVHSLSDLHAKIWELYTCVHQSRSFDRFLTPPSLPAKLLLEPPIVLRLSP